MTTIIGRTVLFPVGDLRCLNKHNPTRLAPGTLSCIVHPVQAAGAAHELKQDSIIVAGFGKEDADGSIERTEAMVGEVMMGWGGILKSTPPAKLLSRPPVRYVEAADIVIFVGYHLLLGYIYIYT